MEPSSRTGFVKKEPLLVRGTTQAMLARAPDSAENVIKTRRNLLVLLENVLDRSVVEHHPASAVILRDAHSAMLAALASSGNPLDQTRPRTQGGGVAPGGVVRPDGCEEGYRFRRDVYGMLIAELEAEDVGATTRGA